MRGADLSWKDWKVGGNSTGHGKRDAEDDVLEESRQRLVPYH